MNSSLLLCPLCGNDKSQHFHADRNREYWQCSVCKLVLVPASQHLSAEQEKAQYDWHQNHPDDPAYRNFLSRLMQPMTAKLTPKASGLDFGCGPGPALARMFEEAGYVMQVYDKFYANNPAVLTEHYDFVTCTEVAEHLPQPGQTLEALLAMLKPGGWLGIMTKLVIDQNAFARWHYKTDPTHISFFSRTTFEWLASYRQCHLEFYGNDVILLQNNLTL